MRRALYFGTNGCPGHSAIPLAGEFSNEKIRKITSLVDSHNLEELFKYGDKSRWFNLKFTIDGNVINNFFGYAVPYSPDDPRGGSKSVILIENGSKEDIRKLFYSSMFLMKQFNKIWDKYNFDIDERL